MKINDYLDAIRSAWSRLTCAGEFDWTCPSRGQCAVTALLVQDWLGGEILRCAFEDGTSHYWNLVPGMGEVDLTREQYPRDLPIPRGDIVPRSRLLEGERALAARTPERYRTLAQGANAELGTQ